MWTDLHDRRYTALYVGNQMRFFFEGVFQCQLQVDCALEAHQMLRDWAKYSFTPEELQQCYRFMKEYVGVTIEDVKIGEDGKFVINGKRIAAI